MDACISIKEGKMILAEQVLLAPELPRGNGNRIVDSRPRGSDRVALHPADSCQREGFRTCVGSRGGQCRRFVWRNSWLRNYLSVGFPRDAATMDSLVRWVVLDSLGRESLPASPA